jgi:hypothetical protein
VRQIGPLIKREALTTTYRDCPTNILGASVIAPVLNQLVLPQAINILSQIGQVNNNQSEDCLALNIWTKPQTGSKLKRKRSLIVLTYGLD